MKQQKLKRVVIKEELVQLTQHRDEALILNQFLYWTPKTVDYVEFVKEETEGKGTVNHGWIYKKSEELIDELMLIGMNVKTVRKHLVSLVDKGYLLRRRNPVKKYDKTYQYRINLKCINADLDTLGYELEGYKECIPKLNKVTGQNGSSKVTFDAFEGDKKDVRKSKMSAAIPKITSDITNKEYITNKEIKNKNDVVNDSNDFKEVKQLYIKYSKNQRITDKDEQLIKDLLASDLEVKVILDLMKQCFNQVQTIKNHKGVWSFSYFKKYIEDMVRLKEEQITNSDPLIYQVQFLGDTEADF